MRKDVTILINSCDKYDDCWNPFFKLFKIHWPDCPYELVLNTETKSYDNSVLPVRTINTSGDLAWSARLRNVVEQIESNYIMFFLEDEFLCSPVNVDEFEKVVEYMRNNTDVGYILLRHSEKQKTKFDEPYFPRSFITEKYQIVGLSAIYRKDFMLKILRDHESPWEFERFATIRSKKYPYKILQYNNDLPVIFDYDDSTKTGYGLRRGKWLPATKPLLDSFGIEVDYEKLGWLTEEDKLEKKENIFDKIKGFIKDENLKRKSLR